MRRGGRVQADSAEPGRNPVSVVSLGPALGIAAHDSGGILIHVAEHEQHVLLLPRRVDYRLGIVRERADGDRQGRRVE